MKDLKKLGFTLIFARKVGHFLVTGIKILRKIVETSFIAI